MKTAALLLYILLAVVSVIPPVIGHGEWEIVTGQNFSSQIRLNPHSLLLITVPWCGESRSLKNEITNLVTSKIEEFGSLKLMVLYRNSEKMLAQTIAAGNGITFLYYHHTRPYKYQGKLRAQNILFSVHPFLLSSPEELPLKHLKSPKSLKDFVESTDKAFLLLEFCGWTHALLSKLRNNVTEHNPGMHGNFSGEVELDRLLKLRGNDKQKAMQSGNMMCSLQNGFGKIPWLEDFSFVNKTAALHEIDGVTLSFGQKCTIDHFEQFSSFFSKLITAAKEFSLPLERHRFGLVTEASLVSSLGVGEFDSWLAVLESAGCPRCLKVLKNGKDIARYLKMENPIVAELEDEGQDFESFLPASKPSVILFTDRSSESSEGEMSKKALSIFREVAGQHQLPKETNWENVPREKFINLADQDKRTVSTLSGLTSKFKNIKLENKVSVMIFDGDKTIPLDNIASDLQGGSLHEMLTNLLHRTKETKLSSIAKDAGFRLLSDDVNVKIRDTLPSQAEVELSSSDTDKHVVEASLQLDSKEESVHSFKGSFFFSDGNYPLLKALTGDTKIPSVIIIDPSQQQHYVFQDEFSYSSLADFLHGYLNGTLSPYTQSESSFAIPREPTSPPFVNLDFHEVDSIPRATVNTFSKLVDESTAMHPQRQDVLVLFGNNWCGFCQRMELIVREVYRALKGFTEADKGGSKNYQRLFTEETSTNDGSLKPPLIYSMDCTLNDCSLILKSTNQREVYPALILFPAERKETILYEGDISVVDIIDFIALHGNYSREFLTKKGILSPVSGKRGKSSSMFDQASSTGADKLFEIDLKNREPKKKVKPQSQTRSHKPVLQITAGTILVASDKLDNTHPFDKSRILIVKADPETGFQGLIVNKRLRWESFPELDEMIVGLLKEAPLSFGGPVVDPGMQLLALTREKTENPEIFPGVGFLNPSAVAREIQELRSRSLNPDNYWFFLGYSSWSYYQLVDEISQGAWDVENDEAAFAWP